jgi:hypothetical protein
MTVLKTAFAAVVGTVCLFCTVSASPHRLKPAQPTRILSPELPFSETGWTIAAGSQASTDGDANFVHCTGCSIQSLTLGKLDIPLKSTIVSPDMMIDTRNYGPLKLQVNFAHGSFGVLVTPEQEARFKRLCGAGGC